jgi:hypothetical protein
MVAFFYCEENQRAALLRIARLRFSSWAACCSSIGSITCFLTVKTTLAAAATVAAVPIRNPDKNRFIFKHLAFIDTFIMRQRTK